MGAWRAFLWLSWNLFLVREGETMSKVEFISAILDGFVVVLEIIGILAFLVAGICSVIWAWRKLLG